MGFLKTLSKKFYEGDSLIVLCIVAGVIIIALALGFFLKSKKKASSGIKKKKTIELNEEEFRENIEVVKRA